MVKKKNPAAVALGRLGGKKGGPARARALSPEQRSDIARRAAEARWANEHTYDPCNGRPERRFCRAGQMCDRHQMIFDAHMEREKAAK